MMAGELNTEPPETGWIGECIFQIFGCVIAQMTKMQGPAAQKRRALTEIMILLQATISNSSSTELFAAADYWRTETSLRDNDRHSRRRTERKNYGRTFTPRPSRLDLEDKAMTIDINCMKNCVDRQDTQEPGRCLSCEDYNKSSDTLKPASRKVYKNVVARHAEDLLPTSGEIGTKDTYGEISSGNRSPHEVMAERRSTYLIRVRSALELFMSIDDTTFEEDMNGFKQTIYMRLSAQIQPKDIRNKPMAFFLQAGGRYAPELAPLDITITKLKKRQEELLDEGKNGEYQAALMSLEDRDRTLSTEVNIAVNDLVRAKVNSERGTLAWHGNKLCGKCTQRRRNEATEPTQHRVHNRARPEQESESEAQSTGARTPAQRGKQKGKQTAPLTKRQKKRAAKEQRAQKVLKRRERAESGRAFGEIASAAGDISEDIPDLVDVTDSESEASEDSFLDEQEDLHLLRALTICKEQEEFLKDKDIAIAEATNSVKESKQELAIAQAQHETWCTAYKAVLDDEAVKNVQAQENLARVEEELRSAKEQHDLWRSASKDADASRQDREELLRAECEDLRGARADVLKRARENNGPHNAEQLHVWLSSENPQDRHDRKLTHILASDGLNELMPKNTPPHIRQEIRDLWRKFDEERAEHTCGHPLNCTHDTCTFPLHPMDIAAAVREDKWSARAKTLEQAILTLEAEKQRPSRGFMPRKENDEEIKVEAAEERKIGEASKYPKDPLEIEDGARAAIEDIAHFPTERQVVDYLKNCGPDDVNAIKNALEENKNSNCNYRGLFESKQ
jgi:hypothetical protein